MALLSKSKYLIGLECPRYLWTIFNDPKSLPEFDEQTQYRFEQGYNVEKYAKQLFEGIDASDDFMNNIKKTKTLINQNKTVFEAGIMIKRLYARADILRYNNGWELYEIKASTSVKETHLEDLAFQKYVFELAGLEIKKCFVIHINTNYVKEGEIDILKLLSVVEVEIKTDHVSENIESMFEIIKLKEIPEIELGKQCKKNYDCPLNCWSILPENNVFDLFRGGKKSLDLYSLGISSLIDIPDDFKLNLNQKIQVNSIKENSVFINKIEIKKWIDSLNYPLYYLDFESFQTAIPLFNNSRPYQQICFQYSLHIQNLENDNIEKIKHKDFLYQDKCDPREDFIKNLIEDLNDVGSIIVYNKTFEITRLKELSKDFPIYEPKIKLIINRIVDLYDIFKNFWYYHPLQKGSTSIKTILPLFSDKNYNDLLINNGNDASLEYMKFLLSDISDEDKKNIKINLIEYCKQDTFAEIIILNNLKELIK